MMKKIACLGAMIAACAASAADLPAGYVELEYIRADGAQWINTGLTPDCTDIISAKVNFTAVNANNCIWCSRGTEAKDATFTAHLIGSGSKIRFDRNNSTSGADSYVVAAGTDYMIVANGSTLAATVNGESAGTMGSGTFTPPNPITLFASYTTAPGTSLGNWATFRMYSFSVTDAGGTPKCSLVPAVRVSDGAVGMYDTVGGAFKENLGTRAFEAGPVVTSNTYTWIGGASGNLATASNWTPAPAGPFTASDELVFTTPAEITLDASATVGKITLNAAGGTQFAASENATLTVANIENAGTGTTTFNCPVQFAGPYYVTQNGAVKFPGGATATYPDNALRTAGSMDQTRTLDGDFTFTSDWVVNRVGDYPWIIASGSTVHGQLFTGIQNAHHRILRIEEGGSAYFTCVTNGWDIGDVDIDGYLEVSGEYVVQTATSGGTAARFGRAGNTGTVKAYRIVKNRNGLVSSLIPNLIVGAGGMGSVHQDYYWRFDADTTVTAAEDFEFVGMYRSGYTYDWCLGLSANVTLTINVPENMTVTFGVSLRLSGGFVRKTGAGTLVMTDTYNGNSGYVKQFSGMFIDEGKVRLEATGQLGAGSVELASGARLEVASGVTLSNVVNGDGTLYLENGVTVAIPGNPVCVGAVELASGASVAVTNTVGTTTAPYAFISGVSAADASRFTYAGQALNLLGDTLMLPYAAATGVYVWNGASGADWAVPGNWLVDGVAPAAAPGSGDTILFENTVPVTVGGTDALTVTKIVTLSDDAVTFSCPVKFAGTYLVSCAAKEPIFAGGATATFPDASLAGMNVPTHTLTGTIAFTADWTAPLQATPFVVSAGSTLTGKKLAATTYDSGKPELRIDEGAVATFETVAVGNLLVFHLNGGRLVATGDVTLASRDFGYYAQPNTGILEANGIYKSVTGAGLISVYVTNMVVGAGGFGMKRKDYTMRFMNNARITAKADMTIWEPQELGTTAPRDTDWGLNLRSHTLTIDTAEHTVNFDSWVAPSNCVIVKEGTGEMVMQGRLKPYKGGTVVKAGTLTVGRSGSQGNGPLTVNEGATLANTLVVSHPYQLALEAGSALKPVQNMYFDVSGGTLVLPSEGTVQVDMTDFTFVNGVASPILAGVAAGDEAKFSALVPAGVSGTFSVSDGFLYYTPTAGGSAAASLFWHPTGEAVWSDSVAAWTNAAGEQVAFSSYANATVADAATISLPADVEANDVTVSADANVTLNGAGKLGGPGTIIKTGSGTFTFNATGGLDAQTIIVSNGVFKMGEDLTGPLGSTADTSPIVVAKGGTLDVNHNAAADNAARNKVTREKLVHVAGDGYDGRGAIVNDNSNTYHTFSDMVLDDDATMGGTKRFDVRGNQTAYVRNGGSIYGPGKDLTVLNPAFFGIVNASVDLKSIIVTNGGALRVEGSTANWTLADGIRLRGGRLSVYNNTCGANVPVFVDSGMNTIDNGSGTATINGQVTVASGATFLQTSGNIVYQQPVSGEFDITNGYAYLDGALRDGFTASCARTGTGALRIRKSGTFSNVDISCRQVGVADASNSTVNVTFRDSTFDLVNLYLGWGTAWMDAYMSIGEGTEMTTTLLCLAYTGTATNKTKSVLSVDGGTLHHTGSNFYICQNGPNADFILNSGTVTVDQATIQLRQGNAVLGGYNSARFIQNGGAFNYGGGGFTARFEDNSDGGQIVLTGGDFNAAASWSIPFYIPLFFGYESTEGWTLNQADGTTATWTTALLGNGDVTLNGTATLVGTNEMQGAVGGKWTVGDGFTAGLEGAASLLGGLALGEGATATVDIATNRSAVFTSRDFGHNPNDTNGDKCITNRFNRAIGGTTRGTITHNETLLFNSYTSAVRPFGNMNYQSTYAVGDFYVEDSAAGTWSFSASCDDWAFLWIDGEQVGVVTSKTWTATKELTTGWHAFRHVTIDNSGTFGGARTVGYKDGSGTMSAYANFSVANLKMRPAADFGDPDNANTVRWSHFKGTSATASASTFKGELDWDFCLITNNLQMLQWYGNTDPEYFNTYTVNRYDGWFLVTAENADKEWTFRTQYDDRGALWIDGVDTGLNGTNKNTLVYSVTLPRGWHHFQIRTLDNTGNAGPWSGKGNAVSYQVADGPQTLFSEQTLQLTVCPDGYVQGGVTLASGATLANGAAENAAVIYGDVTATGMGATISGPFKFEGGTLAFKNVASATTNLANVLAFSNVPADMLADIGAITVDYASAPTRGKIPLCPLYGLTEEAAKAKVTVTIAGEPADHVVCTVENGNITLRNTSGTLLLFR